MKTARASLCFAPRASLCFGIALSLVSGCSVYDESLLGGRRSCDPNTIGCLPAPPTDRSEGDGGQNDQTGVWALTTIDLNQNGTTWQSEGLDLDNVQTSMTNLKQGCVPASGNTFALDGVNGIDNAYGQSLFDAIVRGSVPNLTDQLCCWGRRGRGTILVRVDDWNGTKDDPKVQLSVLYAYDGTTAADSDVHVDATQHELVYDADVTAPLVPGAPAPLPSWTVDTSMTPAMTPTRWWIDPASYIAGNASTPLITDPNAYIKDGFVTMRLPNDGPITLMIGDDVSSPSAYGRGGSLKITLQGAYAWAQLSDDFSHITRGGMAGRLGKNQLLSVASSIGVCVPITAIEYIIDQYGDVHFDPADDNQPTGECDAVSFGTSFQGVRGTVAGTASEGLCLVDACMSKSCGALGSDHGQCGYQNPADSNDHMAPPTCVPLEP